MSVFMGSVHKAYPFLILRFNKTQTKCKPFEELKKYRYERNHTELTPDMLKTGLFTRFVRSVVRIFAPML